VFPIARNITACLGGFVLLGQTVGAFGTNLCGVPFPANAPSLAEEMAWVFTHEFQRPD
jgi:hypothetical protein